MTTIYLMVRGRRAVEIVWHEDGDFAVSALADEFRALAAGARRELGLALPVPTAAGYSADQRLWSVFCGQVHTMARGMTARSDRYVVEVLTHHAPPVLENLARRCA